MATLYTVLSAIQAQVSAVTQGLISYSPDTKGQSLTVLVGLYWPSVKALQDNVRKIHPLTSGPTSLVTVYDRGLASDSTRWLPNVVNNNLLPATTTAFLSNPIIPSLGSVTITFGNMVSIGDALGVVIAPALGNGSGVVPIAVSGDTIETMATKLVSMLTADPAMAALVSATADGPVVTITSLQPNNLLKIQANLGNGGLQLTEIARRKRHFQIVVWARTPDDRITVGDPIESLIASTEANFGLTFPDGTLGRLTFTGDTQHDEATLSDVMRRDFMVCVDYGINVTDVTYSILAPIVQNTTF